MQQIVFGEECKARTVQAFRGAGIDAIKDKKEIPECRDGSQVRGRRCLSAFLVQNPRAEQGSG